MERPRSRARPDEPDARRRPGRARPGARHGDGRRRHRALVGCSHVYEQVSALAARLDAEGIESRACARCIRLRMPERAWATEREGRCGKGPVETTVLVDSHCEQWQACASWRDAHAAAREVLSWMLDALPVFADFVAFVGRARDDTSAPEAESAAIGVAPWSAADEVKLTPMLHAAAAEGERTVAERSTVVAGAR